MDQEILRQAKQHRAEAERLEELAFDTRPLPNYWKVGQLVRMLHDQEWAWSKGDIMKITKLGDPGTPAKDYQVFWTSPLEGGGSFWTTPDDVELYEGK